VLAVGLPSALGHERLLRAVERRHRLVRDGHHRLLHVPPRRQGRRRGQCVALSLSFFPRSLRLARADLDVPHLRADEQVISDARRITGENAETSTYVPIDPREFCGRIFHTCYMGTKNSSNETRQRAKDLAEAIGACVGDFLVLVRREHEPALAAGTASPTLTLPLSPAATTSASTWTPASTPSTRSSRSSRARSPSTRCTAGRRPRTWRCRTSRRACACSSPTSLRSSSPGCAARAAPSSSSAAPTSTKRASSRPPSPSPPPPATWS